ncbi:MAG: gas vesicle protein GvpG [Firmicutes bacterium]|nr:gas vesicle protein GvpG [Bacillota bacterium]MCL5040124.1 gas vesicle protein GvpG [Bacillota bacterium]
MPEMKLSSLDLLFLPLALPAKGLWFILEQITDLVDKELYDEGTLRRKLLDLQVLYELGEIQDEEYRQSWKDITARLQFLRQQQLSDENEGRQGV